MDIFGYLPFIFISIDIVLLIVSLYMRKRYYWNILITVNIVSLLSIIMMFFSSCFARTGYDTAGAIITSVLMGVVLGPIYLIILVVNIVLKAKYTNDSVPATSRPTKSLGMTTPQDEAYINGGANTEKPAEDPATALSPIPTANKSSLALPVLIGLAMVVAIAVAFYLKNEYDIRGTIESYASVKTKELDAMAKHLSDKYGLSVSSGNAIYYLEKDTNKYSTYEFSSTKADVPYYAIFKVGSEEIAVADRDGRISDNRQLKEIDKLISQHFLNQTGIDFDYIIFSTVYGDSSTECIKYSAINQVLQTEMNEKITEKNIDKFVEKLLAIDRISIDFYIKDSNIYSPFEATEHLSYLSSYDNIRGIRVWFYNAGDIEYVVKNDLDKTDYSNNKSWNTGTYVKDSYKFGCTYVVPNQDAEELRYMETDLRKTSDNKFNWLTKHYGVNSY